MCGIACKIEIGELPNTFADLSDITNKELVNCPAFEHYNAKYEHPRAVGLPEGGEDATKR
eukprot:7789185-Pyramimonas_sp.AAC.1